MLAQGLGEFGELGDAPVDGVVERALVDFKVVARVERDHGAAFVVVSGVEPAAQGFGGDGGGAA
ncbi:hypothetical protein SDC9_157847 [bioreactor metagenome]|uniref:Uncharacterized protein n=1 Tax=bioreactor metagenome TaxID=1076179 RepID=A0A645FAG4_9ZZZZ